MAIIEQLLRLQRLLLLLGFCQERADPKGIIVTCVCSMGSSDRCFGRRR